MNIYLQLHLLAIVPALFLGPFVLFRERDSTHVILGKIWVILMLLSCSLSFGITHQGSYSWLHGLALFTIYQVIRGLRAIKKRDLETHKRAMVGSYAGTVIAFLFASLLPNRLINTWILGFFQ